MQEENRNLENEEKSIIKEETKSQSENTNKKTKRIKTRTYIVLAVLAIFILGSLITYRADYIEAEEIGQEYVETFMQNVKYKTNIGIINFLVVFIAVYITNKFIKKGLRQFFDEEKKELPKLPNKSLALIIALVTSIIVSKMFLQKVIMFINAASFGISDPIYNMDMGFYMFQMPLIRTTSILWSSNITDFNSIYSCILFNSI